MNIQTLDRIVGYGIAMIVGAVGGYLGADALVDASKKALEPNFVQYCVNTAPKIVYIGLITAGAAAGACMECFSRKKEV